MSFIQWVGIFGLPAENASKQNNLHPKRWTEKNIETMKNQLKLLGLSIDWKSEISTCDPNYYKHQQELFIDFYNQGLISRKETYVNWDPIEKRYWLMNKLLMVKVEIWCDR